MIESTTSASDESDPVTGPVHTAAPTTADRVVEPQTIYVQQPASRLSKAAAWVGIAAGTVFIVAVIFGAGVFVGTNIGDDHGDGPRHRHGGGPEMVLRPGPPFPMGPPGGFERDPRYPGPTGSGPAAEAPRPPGGPAAPRPTPTTPARP